MTRNERRKAGEENETKERKREEKGKEKGGRKKERDCIQMTAQLCAAPASMLMMSAPRSESTA